MTQRNNHPEGHNHPLQWWNGISTGNVLTMLGGVITLGVWVFVFGGAMAKADATDTDQEKQLTALAVEVKAVEGRSNEKIAALKDDIRIVSANLNQLLLSQGIKPKITGDTP